MGFEAFALQDLCSLEWMQKILQYDGEGGAEPSETSSRLHDVIFLKNLLLKTNFLQ
jgi:hypothetical protein